MSCARYKPGDLIKTRDYGRAVWWSNRLGIYVRCSQGALYAEVILVSGKMLFLDDSEFMKA